MKIYRIENQQTKNGGVVQSIDSESDVVRGNRSKIITYIPKNERIEINKELRRYFNSSGVYNLCENFGIELKWHQKLRLEISCKIYSALEKLGLYRYKQ